MRASAAIISSCHSRNTVCVYLQIKRVCQNVIMDFWPVELVRTNCHSHAKNGWECPQGEAHTNNPERRLPNLQRNSILICCQTLLSLYLFSLTIAVCLSRSRNYAAVQRHHVHLPAGLYLSRLLAKHLVALREPLIFRIVFHSVWRPNTETDGCCCGKDHGGYGHVWLQHVLIS